MPTKMDTLGASLVIGSIWSGTLMQDILLLGGTWPPAGMKTTSGRNATRATSQTKADSGDLAKRLIESSPGEQRRLWKELKQGRRTQPTRYEQLSSITRRNLKRLKEKRTFDGNGLPKPSREELETIDHLRYKRRVLMFEIAEGMHKTNRKRKYEQLVQIANALYDLTNDETYLL